MDILKLVPAPKEIVWGGVKLKNKYGKKADFNHIAETWELSFHKDGESRLENGKTLRESVAEEDLGVNCNGMPFFPMLIKFIDAAQDLSVQVHPSDDYALREENSYGKTEMWYIVEADEGAGIYIGFNQDITKEEYAAAIAEKRLTELLNFVPVKKGECYFIPSGTIHAIGAGCLICEIQQNSNLTYRVYDYGRKDKDGKERELHVEKAQKVTCLNKYTPVDFSSREVLGKSKYFTTTSVKVKGQRSIFADKNSFACLVCVAGKGEIDGNEMAQGDSWFIPAGKGEVILKGDMQIIMAQVRKYYVGIDLGGTFIKGGIVDDLGNIICEDKTPTEKEKGQAGIVKNIANLAEKLLKTAGLEKSDVVGLGMGCPGMIDGKNGVVVFSNNINFKDFFIAEEVSKLTGLKVKVANDANVAALGETKFGSAKGYDNTILITLGTGVGGGVVIDGALFEGVKGAGAELGHSVIVASGEVCSCGRKGCLEAYASATALIRETKKAMEEHKDSKMWEIGSLDNVTGKTAFDYKDTDVYAKAVVDNYIEKLAVGLTNFANIFRPEVILLGGGVCAQGDNLVKPLQALLDRDLYAGKLGPQVPIKTASLGNSAGLLGAAALWM